MQCYKLIIQLCLFGLSLVHLSQSGHYTGEWAVHIEGGEEKAKKLAEDYGFVYLGKVGTLIVTESVVFLFFLCHLL